jgi:cysteine synthase B
MGWLQATVDLRRGRAPAAAAAHDLASAIGNTPLLRLTRIAALPPRVALYVKAEWFNPGGSVKDRPALAIVRDAEARGLLGHGRTLIDSTSGNTGIAYAMLGAARGFHVKLVVPGNLGEARLALLRHYGAELIFSDPLEGSDGALELVQRLVAADPGRHFYADQYNNPANWRAHFLTTAVEIWEQTRGQVTHLVAGVGTGGTLTGTARRLRELAAQRGRALHAIEVQPDAPFHGLEGLKHMPTAIVPGVYDPALAERVITPSAETAYAMARRLAREEGLLVGVSAAAAVSAALDVARELTEGALVAILPDGGMKYLGERFWNG